MAKQDSVNLFGVLRGRSAEIDWHDNPHKAVAECQRLNIRKIFWLTYQPDFVHPQYDSNAWQVKHNLSHFVDRVLPGFAPADSPVWQD